MTRITLPLLLLPFWALASDSELWLVELERNDGIRLQFQGAELELGSARLSGVRHADELRPGMRLAILSRNGVAEHIRLADAATGSDPLPHWRRAEAPLLVATDRSLQLQGLGTVTFDAGTRWLNGSYADLHAGSELVLTRDEQGRLSEILVVNPEE